MKRRAAPRRKTQTRADQYSDLESEFLNRWQQFAPGMPMPEHNIGGLIPGRKHEVDFVWHAERVIVETEGGAYTQGRHTRGAGFESDCEKYNLLTALGYRVFRFTRGMLRRDPIACVNIVRDALDPLPFADADAMTTNVPPILPSRHWTAETKGKVK